MARLLPEKDVKKFTDSLNDVDGNTQQAFDEMESTFRDAHPEIAGIMD